MKIKVRHNQHTLTIEDENCTQEQLMKAAVEQINLYYVGHINEVYIRDQIIKFKVKIEEIK